MSASLVLVILGFWLAFKLALPCLMALLAGGMIALILDPLQDRLRKRVPMPKALSALILCLVAFVGVLLPVGILLWGAVRDGIKYFSSVDWAELGNKIPIDRLAQYLPLDAQQIREHLINVVKDGSTQAATFLGGVITAVPENIFNFFITLVTCYFFLKEGSAFYQWLVRHSPFKESVRDRLIRTIEDTTQAVIAAAITSALIQAILTGLAFLICHVPKVWFFGVVTFFAAFIPVVGAAPIWIGGAVYLYFNHHPAYMVTMIVLGGVISLSDNFTKPLVIRGRSPMHPMVALLAIIGGLSWMGVIGVFMGPILAATLLTLIELRAENEDLF